MVPLGLVSKDIAQRLESALAGKQPATWPKVEPPEGFTRVSDGGEVGECHCQAGGNREGRAGECRAEEARKG